MGYSLICNGLRNLGKANLSIRGWSAMPLAAPSAFPELPSDATALLLWRIARRADELVQQSQRGPGLNRVCWLIAEEELAGHLPEAALLLSHENLPRAQALQT